MKVITIGGQKGGTGKTTIAAELAVNLSKEANLLFVDTDPQGSSTDFCNSRRDELPDLGFTAIQLQDKAVLTEVTKLKAHYDYVIIDAGGYDTASQRYALSITDIYISVFKPESLALWTLENVEKIIEEMSLANPNLVAYSLLNLGWPSGCDNEESAEILRESEKLKLLPCVIQRRKAFCDATGKGLSVKERLPKDSKAISEINDLLKHLKGN